MQRDYSLPDFDRMSIVLAIVLLSYASARFIEIPTQSINLDFAGLFLSLRINLNTITSVMVAVLAAAGTDWILQSKSGNAKQRIQHWMIPALTAWIISLPLANLPLSPEWWLVFIGGAVLLGFVLIAEFISQNPLHRYYALASSALVALSYALFLMLAISLQALEIRLILLLPTLFFAAGVISIRVQLLSQTTELNLPSIAAMAFLIAQIGAALHYYPISSLAFAFLMLGLLYALNGLISGLSSEKALRDSAIEALGILGVFAIISLFLT